MRDTGAPQDFAHRVRGGFDRQRPRMLFSYLVLFSLAAPLPCPPRSPAPATASAGPPVAAEIAISFVLT